MIRHLLKLVWNRKRANGLIMLEIFLSFLVVFGIASTGLFLTHRYLLPVGFTWDNVWSLTAGTNQQMETVQEQRGLLRDLHRELAQLPGIRAVSRSGSGAYDFSSHVYGDEVDGETIHTEVIDASHEFADVLRIPVVEGRWFREGDAVDDKGTVVINRAFSRVLFGDESPIGKNLPGFGEGLVVGLVDDFRKNGEFGKPGNVVFRLHGPESFHPAMLFTVRVDPGAGSDLELAMLDRFAAIMGAEWSPTISRMAEVRREQNRLHIAPMILVGIIAAFLLLMVALGLIGVLWQNVTRRTSEIGLRRAIGADRGRVYRQILLELLLLASFAVGAGILIVIQFPLLTDLGFLEGSSAWGGVAFSAAVIYGLVLACGLYPAALASRIQPADALHYE